MMHYLRYYGATLLAAVVVVCSGGSSAQSRRPPLPDYSHSTTTPPPANVETAIPRMRVGVDPNPRTSTSYRGEDWAESVALMRTTPANHRHDAKTWSELEPSAGKYDLDEMRFMLEKTDPLPVAFNLRVVDAGQRNRPADDKPLAWDSAEMIEPIGGIKAALAASGS